MTRMSWDDFDGHVDLLVKRARAVGGKSGYSGVYGIPRGGSFVAYAVARKMCLPMLDHASKTTRILVVDDLIDSGRTLERLDKEWGHNVKAYQVLCSKGKTEFAGRDGNVVKIEGGRIPALTQWVVFPWEHGEEQGPTDAITRIIQFIGEDPHRDGLKETPERVVRAFRDLTKGYTLDPEKILSKRFLEFSDEMIVVSEIPFFSLCEHHILPFSGTVSVGYLPKERVVGLSKIPRLVECYARRLQIQERMTRQIAEAIDKYLEPVGVGVIVKATHSCMTMRGIQKHGVMTTSALLGKFKTDHLVRDEFLRLA